MITRTPILLGICFCVFSTSYGQDFSGEWYGPSIYMGDSSKLITTKDSLYYYSLGKYPLANPYAYKIVDVKKKHGKLYLFLTTYESPKIHVIEEFHPDSCLKIYMDDIADFHGDLLPIFPGHGFKEELKRLKKNKLNGLSVPFYTRNVFEGFKSLRQLSSITDTSARELVISKLIAYRHEMKEKFGYRAFEDQRLAQWLYFDFFASNKLYPFGCMDQVYYILKEKNWPAL